MRECGVAQLRGASTSVARGPDARVRKNACPCLCERRQQCGNVQRHRVLSRVARVTSRGSIGRKCQPCELWSGALGGASARCPPLSLGGGGIIVSTSVQGSREPGSSFTGDRSASIALTPSSLAVFASISVCLLCSCLQLRSVYRTAIFTVYFWSRPVGISARCSMNGKRVATLDVISCWRHDNSSGSPMSVRLLDMIFRLGSSQRFRIASSYAFSTVTHRKPVTSVFPRHGRVIPRHRQLRPAIDTNGPR